MDEHLNCAVDSDNSLKSSAERGLAYLCWGRASTKKKKKAVANLCCQISVLVTFQGYWWRHVHWKLQDSSDWKDLVFQRFLWLLINAFMAVFWTTSCTAAVHGCLLLHSKGSGSRGSGSKVWPMTLLGCAEKLKTNSGSWNNTLQQDWQIKPKEKQNWLSSTDVVRLLDVLASWKLSCKISTAHLENTQEVCVRIQNRHLSTLQVGYEAFETLPYCQTAYLSSTTENLYALG